MLRARARAQVYNLHKFANQGGDLNGTSGDNGAENWDMRVFSPFFQYFSLKNGKQKYNKK